MPHFAGVAADSTGTLVMAGTAANASGAWSDLAATAKAISPTLTPLSPTAASSGIGAASVNAAVGSPAGVTDAGGSAVDGLVVRTGPAAAAPPSNLPAITAFQNAASSQDGGTDGSWAAIKGSNLAPDTPSGRIWTNDDFTSNANLPTQLDGVSVTVDGKPAAVYYVSPSQINIQVPATGKTGPVDVVVSTSKGAGSPFRTQIAAYAPGLFLLSQGGFKYPAALTSDGLYLGPSGLLGSGAAVRPARPGEVISLFATGLGPTQPAIAPGTFGWTPAQTAQPVSATIGNLDAQIQWAGLISPGEYQINVTIPGGLADGESPIVVRAGGTTSQSGVFIAVQAPAVPKNPSPTIASLSPSSAAAGSAAPAVTITGTGFIAASSATFGGAARQTTFLSATQVSVTLSNSDVATAGAYPIVVTNPAPGGGASNAATFTVTAAPPPPTLQSLSLSAASVVGGGSVSGTVRLSAPVPIGGAVLTLRSSSGVVTVPSSIPVSATVSVINFTAATTAVTSAQTVTITATYGASSQTATLTVLPAPSSGLALQGTLFSIDGTLTISGKGLRFEIQAAAVGSAHLITIDDQAALPSFPQLLAQYTATGSISGNTATFTSSSVTGLYQASATSFGTVNSATLVLNFSSPASTGSSVTGTLTLSTSSGAVQATFTGSLSAFD